MAQPKSGDRAVYRGRYREIVGFKSGPDDAPGASGPVCVMVNPETERNTYVRTEDLAWSDYLGAWYPRGLILSREEAALYSALMGLGQIVPADAHERACKVLDAEDLDAELDGQTARRLDRFALGYWGARVDEAGEVVTDDDGRPVPGKGRPEIVAAARELRAHREEVA